MRELLAKLGFAEAAPLRWARDDCELEVGAAWWTLRRAAPCAPDWLVRPGPWTRDPAGRPTCDVPPAPLDAALAILDWAWSTRDGEAPARPAAPVLAPDGLVVRAGDLVRRARVRGARIELELVNVPPLSAARRRWLDATLAAARRTRCVRIGADAMGRVVACADFTGCPPEHAPAWIQRTTAALAAAARRLLAPLQLLTDAGVASRALEFDALAPSDRDRE